MTVRDAYGGPVSHLVFSVAKAHRGLAQTLLRDLGLHAGQELMMMTLWENGPQPQSALIALLGLDASTVTRMVQRLEQAGFVRRERSATDGRAMMVASTAAGRALRDKVVEAWTELETRTLRGLDAAEVAELTRLLSKVAGNLSSDDG